MKRLNLNDSCRATVAIIISAALYALCIPCIKALSAHVTNIMTGGLLYAGAGLGLLIISFFKKINSEIKLTKNEFPYVLAMILLDICAVTLLVVGISKTQSANASLLGNFELVVTTLVARFFFKELISKKTAIGIILITIAIIILSCEGESSFVFSTGSLFVSGACVCWGIENNCTKMLSDKDTRQITMIKGCFSGLGGIILALIFGEHFPEVKYIILTGMLGVVSYGVSVCLYIYAQRYLGAAKTGAFNCLAPFFGVFFGFILFGNPLELKFYSALFIMIVGTYFLVKDILSLQ